MPMLPDFYTLSPDDRHPLLLNAVVAQHAWHYPRNAAYRHHCEGRGIGPSIGEAELVRVLRPTAQTFKSYVGELGTAFPQDCPAEFARWLAAQLSVEVAPGRWEGLRPRYGSLEALLTGIEALFAAERWRIATSSGTSGRASIMVRDEATFSLALDSFFLGIQHAWGIDLDYRLIFVMPEETRIAMAQAARFGTEKLGYVARGQVEYTIPFPASPDVIRIRTGQTLRSGVRGWLEKRVASPFMNWMGEHVAIPRSVRATVEVLRRCANAGEKLMLFGGPIQLHGVALMLQREGVLELPPGCLVGTGGGMKEAYHHSFTEIRRDIAAVLRSGGQPMPIRDVYGMAEANWAAFECPEGHHHLPPWAYAVALDTADTIIDAPDAEGILAFYDPFGGGNLFPPFFKTTDRVHLINGGRRYDPARACPCGEPTAYITAGTISRADLQDESGCAGQV
jgi:hypothetical protein